MSNQSLQQTAGSLLCLLSVISRPAAAEFVVSVMAQQSDPLDQAVFRLGWRRTFRHDGRAIQIACLVRSTDLRPLQAPWWRGKEVCVLGADLDGNLLLAHCDGTVRLWDHRAKADTVLAPSIREFVAGIEE